MKMDRSIYVLLYNSADSDDPFPVSDMFETFWFEKPTRDQVTDVIRKHISSENYDRIFSKGGFGKYTIKKCSEGRSIYY